MTWLSLDNLWFSAVIPAIIILYLLKRKYVDRTIGSVLLWQQVLQHREASRPFQKLRYHLLLLLQLLAALLLLLALLKPAIPDADLLARHTILVIDNSGSMQAREGDSTRFQNALQAANEQVDRLGSDQSMTIIEAGNVPRILVSHTHDQQLLHTQINRLSPRYSVSDQAKALSLANAIASSVPDSGIIWYGDGGNTSLNDQTRINIRADHFRFEQLGASQENLALGAFITQPTSQGITGLIRIDNHGISPREGNVLIYDQDHKLLDAAAFKAEARGFASITLSGLPRGRAYEAVLEAGQDGLAADNTLWSIPVGSRKAKVMLVSAQGNLFLHKVLENTGLEVETMNELPQNTKIAADLWIFDGLVPRQLPAGNLLFIGPTQAASYLPLEGTYESEAGEWQSEQNHPLLRYTDFHDVHVAAISHVKPLSNLQPIVKNATESLILAGEIEGRRAIVLPFDLHQSDLPLRPAFPIFMQNALAWLSPNQAAPIATGIPGEALQIALTPGAQERTLITPDGQSTKLADGGNTWIYQVPDQLGLYQLVERLDTGQQTRFFAAQLPEAESTIKPNVLQVTSTLKDGTGTDTAHEQESLSIQSVSSYQELTGWLILLLLLILFAEWRVYQRGY